MGYEQLYTEFSNSPAYESLFPLASQPTYAIFSGLISLLLISFAFALTSSKMLSNSGFIFKFLTFFVVSFVASLFCGITTVFSTNSFGVYV